MSISSLNAGASRSWQDDYARNFDPGLFEEELTPRLPDDDHSTTQELTPGGQASPSPKRKTTQIAASDLSRYEAALKRAESDSTASSRGGPDELEKARSYKRVSKGRLITGNKTALTFGTASVVASAALLANEVGYRAFAAFALSPAILLYRYYQLGMSIRTSLKHPTDYASHWNVVSRSTFAANATISNVKNIAHIAGFAVKTGVLTALTTTFSALSGALLIGTFVKWNLQHEIIEKIKEAKDKDAILKVIQDHPRLFSRELYEAIRLSETDSKCDLYQRLNTLLGHDFDATKDFILKKMELIITGAKVDIVSNTFFVLASISGLFNPIASFAMLLLGVTVIGIKEGVVMQIMKSSVSKARDQLLQSHLQHLEQQHDQKAQNL